MTDLMVTNIDEQIVKALKAKAIQSGHSVEAEHRLILSSVLLMPKEKTFAEVLATMPNVGCDGDFERLQESENPDVFDS